MANILIRERVAEAYLALGFRAFVKKMCLPPIGYERTLGGCVRPRRGCHG
jgi:hypothetical protein